MRLNRVAARHRDAEVRLARPMKPPARLNIRGQTTVRLESGFSVRWANFSRQLILDVPFQVDWTAYGQKVIRHYGAILLLEAEITVSRYDGRSSDRSCGRSVRVRGPEYPVRRVSVDPCILVGVPSIPTERSTPVASRACPASVKQTVVANGEFALS